MVERWNFFGLTLSLLRFDLEFGGVICTKEG